MGGEVVLGDWDYEDVEGDVRRYAERVQAVYQESRPLAFLPEGCVRAAVERIGTSRSELAEISGFRYTTVAGWVGRARRLTRAVVAGSLFPALCEAYARRRGAGKPRDRISVEGRVAAIICTGEPTTREERILEEAARRRDYHRSILRLAASFLDGDELADAAHSVGAILARHSLRPTQQEEPDELAMCMEDMGWALWLDRADELERLDDMGDELGLLDRPDGGGLPDAALVVRNGTVLIGDTAERKRLLDMDELDFDFERMLISNCEKERARAVEYDSSDWHARSRA